MAFVSETLLFISEPTNCIIPLVQINAPENDDIQIKRNLFQDCDFNIILDGNIITSFVFEKLDEIIEINNDETKLAMNHFQRNFPLVCYIQYFAASILQQLRSNLVEPTYDVPDFGFSVQSSQLCKLIAQLTMLVVESQF